jgi:hypothetical protein
VSNVLLLCFEHRSGRFVVLASVLIEALRSHVEVLNFEMLDSISKNSVLLTKVNQFRINVVHAHTIFRSHLFLALSLVISKFAVLSVGIYNLTFDFTG